MGNSFSTYPFFPLGGLIPRRIKTEFYNNVGVWLNVGFSNFGKNIEGQLFILGKIWYEKNGQLCYLSCLFFYHLDNSSILISEGVINFFCQNFILINQMAHFFHIQKCWIFPKQSLARIKRNKKILNCDQRSKGKKSRGRGSSELVILASQLNKPPKVKRCFLLWTGSWNSHQRPPEI